MQSVKGTKQWPTDRNLFAGLWMSQLRCVNNISICQSSTSLHCGNGRWVAGCIGCMFWHNALILLVAKELWQVGELLLAFTTLKHIFLLHCKWNKNKFMSIYASCQMCTYNTYHLFRLFIINSHIAINHQSIRTHSYIANKSKAHSKQQVKN